MREYELRDYLEAIQDRAVEQLMADLPPQGDSTNTQTDGPGEDATARSDDDLSDYDAGSNVQQASASSKQDRPESRHTSPHSDPDDEEDGQQHHYSQMERERSMTIGAI